VRHLLKLHEVGQHLDCWGSEEEGRRGGGGEHVKHWRTGTSLTLSTSYMYSARVRCRPPILRAPYLLLLLNLLLFSTSCLLLREEDWE
jgi:hypothetical protein